LHYPSANQQDTVHTTLELRSNRRLPAASRPSNAPPFMIQDSSRTAIHDARSVHDTASFQFRDFVLSGHPYWVMAAVTPAPDSGSAATIPASHIDKTSGQLVFSKGERPALKKAGNWTEIATAPLVSKGKGSTYSWLEVLESHKRVLFPEDYYSPFISGGTIVFHYVPEATGKAQFESVKLIFDDWAQDVAPASAFVESHPGLLEGGEKKAPELLQLRSLLTIKNKLLAVEAFRELATSGHLDANVALACLNEADNPLNAIFSYLMLANGGGEEFYEKINSCHEREEQAAVDRFGCILGSIVPGPGFQSRNSKQNCAAAGANQSHTTRDPIEQ
jgi:hypothetical protein